MSEGTTQRRIALTKDLKRDIEDETDIANENRAEQLNSSEEIPHLISDGIKYRRGKRKAPDSKGRKK